MARRRKVPGISPNPMTNLILTDIALRGVGRLARRVAEKSLLRTRFSGRTADKVVEGRSMGATLASVALARIATKSVPGAFAVGGGLLAKTLYDHARGGDAKREGRRDLRKRIKKADNKTSV